MAEPQLRIAYITAGAAGMYCGSCMLDNTLVRALVRQGVDAQLIPTYTPIRTDEDNISVDRIFFGGINVFLQQKIPLFRYIPGFFDRFLDQPWLIRRATAKASKISAKQLGGLTVSMLRGASGFQRKEVRRLGSWLADSARPDLIQLSNMLIAGCVPTLKKELGVPVLVTLQGDDIFLESLVEPHKSRAFDEIRRLVEHVDGFVVHSQYYADFMADYFSIPRDKLHVTFLGIDTTDFDHFRQNGPPARPVDRPPTVGYLARLAPEKGLHVLVDAFRDLRTRPGMERAELRVAGWLGEHNRDYAEAEFAKLREAGLDGAFKYVGAVDRQTKIGFLHDIDVLSVPTTYHEPKGLFVLEALAAGVPVVQPEHGAFPELIAATGGGRLTRPNDSRHLADTLYEMLTDADACNQIGQHGFESVHQRFNSNEMARAMLELYKSHVR